MTAVAGILNKQGVAIAADSAVTVNGFQGRKVYNSANKIFTLSKYHPVGVAIYNSAQFMGVPWEIIIKEYRKNLGEKNFPKLYDFKLDFFEWLKSKNYFIDESSEDFIYVDLVTFINEMLNTIQNIDGVRPSEERLLEYLSEYVNKSISQDRILESLKDLEKEKVEKIIRPYLDQLILLLNQNLGVSINKGIIEPVLVEAYFKYLIHDSFLQYTGLIFTGYGENEVFPRMYPVNISLVIDDKLRYVDDLVNKAEVSNKVDSFIRPFAQTDVITTILQGISPELNILSTKAFSDFITGFIGELKSIPGMPLAVQNGLDGLNTDAYIDKYQQAFDNIINDRYVHPLMGAVAQLSKEDLAEMAESLVYLTYLKRRFTMAEESVGGPVDIAVITKGDGFIWIKRKHYFDPSLNRSYFDKYL